MKRFLGLLSALAVWGCSGPAPIVLHDPDTKQVVQCAADPWRTWEWDQARANEDCARKYESAGFKRL